MARSTAVQSQMFFIYTQLTKLQNIDLFIFFRNFSLIFCRFPPIYHGNMANFKYSFAPPKAISFQIQLYYFSPNVLWIAALAYCVVAFAFFAQISPFLLLNPLFTHFSLPHFGHLSFLSIYSF